MLKWILQDIKRSLLSRKTYILMLVVLMSIGGQFYMHNESNRVFDEDGVEIVFNYGPEVDLERGRIFNILSEEINYVHSLAGSLSPAKCLAEIEDYFGRNEFDPDECHSLYIFDQSYAKYYRSDNQEISNDEALDLYFYLFDKRTESFFDDYDNSDVDFQKVLAEKTLNFDELRTIKNNIKETIKFDLPEFDGIKPRMGVKEINEISIKIFSLNYIISNNLPINLESNLTATFFIAKYINNFFLLLLLLGILAIYDTFYRDYKSGVIKNILTSPTKRSRYLFMKTISAFVTIFIIMALPVLLTALGLYLYLGYDALNYPVYISKRTLSSFTPVRQYSPVISDFFPDTVFSKFETICEVGPVTSSVIEIKNPIFDTVPFCRLDALTVTSISLKYFILLLMGYYFLLMTFIASLNSLMSMLVKKELYNLIIFIVILSVSGLIAQFFIGSSVLKLLPFTFINPTRLIMGTLPYTFLNGVVILSVWTIGLIITNLIIIKRIDFTY